MASKGKGKVRPRKKELERLALQPPEPIKLDAIAFSDAEAGARADDVKPRFPKHLADGQVERVKYGTERARAAMKEGKPLVLTGCPVTETLCAEWHGFASVAELAGSSQDFACWVSEARHNRFFFHEKTKNRFGSYWYVKEFETKKVRMGLGEFTACARKWGTRNVLLKATVQEAAVGQAAEEIPNRCDRTSIPMAHGLIKKVKWSELREVYQKQWGFGRVDKTQLVCGTKNGLQPCFYELRDQLIFQVSGRRRFLIIDPGYSFKGLYPYPQGHPLDRHSMIDFECPATNKFQKFEDVRGKMAILQPGDMLYLPQYYWTHVQCLEEECIALHMYVDGGSRVRGVSASVLSTSRLLEERVIEREGQKEAKIFFEAVAAGEESELIDTSTIKGLARVNLATMIRDEIDQQIGRGRWQEFLKEMVDMRLEKTPWLDASITNPLLIADKAYYEKDTRDEIQIRFPELFSHLKDGREADDEVIEQEHD